MSLLEEFSKGLEGKDINQLVHEAKADSEERLLGQGVAYLALFISELMLETVTLSARTFVHLQDTSDTSHAISARLSGCSHMVSYDHHFADLPPDLSWKTPADLMQVGA